MARTCNYKWAVRLPDGRIVEECAGRAANINEDGEYTAGKLQGYQLGAFMEFTGGNLGKLILFLKEDYPEYAGKEVEILIEGRWKRVKIDD